MNSLRTICQQMSTYRVSRDSHPRADMARAQDANTQILRRRDFAVAGGCSAFGLGMAILSKAIDLPPLFKTVPVAMLGAIGFGVKGLYMGGRKELSLSSSEPSDIGTMPNRDMEAKTHSQRQNVNRHQAQDVPVTVSV